MADKIEREKNEMSKFRRVTLDIYLLVYLYI